MSVNAKNNFDYEEISLRPLRPFGHFGSSKPIEPISSQKDFSIFKSPEELDKCISGILKKLQLNKLIHFPENPFLPEVDKETLAKHTWSIENWALWSRKVAECFTTERKKTVFPNEKDLIRTSYSKIISLHPDCPPGALAQIVDGFGSSSRFLGTSSREFTKDFTNWVMKNAIDQLDKFSITELYLFVKGAQKCLSKQQLNKFLFAYSKHCEKNPEKCIKIDQELRPHGIACILKAFASSECKTKFANQLLALAQEKFEQFKPNELTDLITGLNPWFFKNPPDALELLKKIEEKLASTEIRSDSLVIATEHFAYSGYLPDSLVPHMEKMLQDQKVPLWDKVNLLSTTAALNMKEPFSKHFRSLLNSIQQAPDIKSTIENIYPKDIVYILHAAAIFLDSDEKPPILPILIDRVFSKLHTLNLKEKTTFAEALRALHYYSEALKIEMPLEKGTMSNSQAHITNTVKNWFYSHSLENISVISEGDIQGRKVDILITGFKDTGIQKQKDLAIEVDGPYHFACNRPSHSLGKNVIRTRSLEGMNIQVQPIHLKDGVEAANNEVLRFLDTMWEKHWKPQASNSKTEPRKPRKTADFKTEFKEVTKKLSEFHF